MEYLWSDQRKTAAQYIDLALSSANSLITDENSFPTRANIAFPPTFANNVKQIFKHLLRIISHIYYAHYDKIVQLSSNAHLNTLTIHLVCFAQEFDLIDKKEYLPLHDFIQANASKIY
jgi:MOB kinase activator 1